jgi:hypothetical protein
VLGDDILHSEHDFRRRFGVPAFRALSEFHKTCAALYRTRITMRAMSQSTASTHGHIGRFAKYSTKFQTRTRGAMSRPLCAAIRRPSRI